MKLALIVPCLLICNFAFAQKPQTKDRAEKPDSNLCPVKYEDVINRLFRLDTLGQGSGYGLLLRYQPPDEPERQINFFAPESGDVEVFLYEANDNGILVSLEEMVRKDKRTRFADAVKKIKVKKTEVKFTAEEVMQIRKDFFETFQRSVEFENRLVNRKIREVRLFDCASSEVRFLGEHGINMTGGGSRLEEKADEDEAPFIGWARRVFQLVQKRLVETKER